MIEYKDNILLGLPCVGDKSDDNRQFCSIKNEAAEDLDELTRLVGEGHTLEESGEDDPVMEDALPAWIDATEADVPRLEFDLEDELSRAFDGRAASEPAKDLGPDFGSQALHKAVEGEDLSSLKTVPPQSISPEHSPSEVADLDEVGQIEDPAEQASPVQPILSADAYSGDIDAEPVLSDVPPIPVSEPETLSFDDEPAVEEGAFSGMVSQEIEKALSEFDQDNAMNPATPSTEAPAPISAEGHEAVGDQQSALTEDSLEDFSMELARLMGEPDAVDSATASSAVEPAAPPAPPQPSEALTPWETPEIVEQSAPPVDEASSISEQSVQQATAYQPTYSQPPQFPQAAPLEVPAPESSNRVDEVLAQASAVETAAAQDAILDDGFDHDLEEALSRELDAELESSAEQSENGPTIIPPIYMPGAERTSAGFGGRKLAAGIALVALLGGSAALAWNFVSSDDSEPPTILASQEPVKVKPEDTGGKVVPNQDQSVYTAVDGKDKSEPKQEVLKDTSEKPMQVAKAPAAAEQPQNAATAGAATSQNPAADPQTTGGPIVQPRRVRTVVVRPDGTILTASQTRTPEPEAEGQDDIALATSAEAPAPVSVKTVSASAEPEASESQTQISAVTPEPVDQNASTETQEPAAPQPAEAVPTPQAAEKPAVEPAAQEAPKPAPAAKKPAPKPVQVTKVEPPKPVVKKPEQPSASEQTADPLAPPKTSSPYKVQVSSRRTREAAQSAYNSLARRFAGIIGGKGVDYQETTVKGKDYVRVRIPAESKAAAQQMCSQLKANGGDCFVTR